MAELVYNVSEAAEALGISRRSMYELLHKEGFPTLTEDYRARENWLENFINERCVKDPNAREGARALYLEYKDWAQDAGEFIRRENDFAAAMEKAGYQRIKPKGRWNYTGLHIAWAEK